MANKELATASDVARWVGVDLKTIHNWADKGKLPHFRTPGRHLRFLRADVLAMMRKYGYPTPDELRSETPCVVLLSTDLLLTSRIAGVLGDEIELVRHGNLLEGVAEAAGIRGRRAAALILSMSFAGTAPSYVMPQLRAAFGETMPIFEIGSSVFTGAHQYKAEDLETFAADLKRALGLT